MTRSRRNAFTMTELVVCLIIIAILAAFSLNPHITDQTAKKEAEKIALFMHKLARTAERTKQKFTININTTERELKATWANNTSETFKAAANFAISYNNGSSIIYNPSTGSVTHFGTLTVTRNDEAKHKNETDKTPYIYYVVISSVGRIRTSDTAPNKGSE